MVSLQDGPQISINVIMVVELYGENDTNVGWFIKMEIWADVVIIIDVL